MTACPDDDLLGAYLHRVLDPPGIERVAAHLDDCTSCRAIVLAAVRGGVATPVPEVGEPRAMAETAVDRALPVKRGPAAVGSTIGRYQVRALIGGGGMGHVYEAYDKELDRPLALKILRPDLRGAAVVLAERLLRESRLMAKVVHPSVITVHDVGREDDAVFIAMELIRGDTLGGYAPGKPWREIVELYERAGEGLAAAHRAGIVHRDFKPDNVLIELIDGRPERVVVTDFGIARAAIDDDAPRSATVPADIKLTTTGAAIGTPAYMAPEQLAGEVADERADVFAFSVSLWESLFGTRPFPGASVAEIQAALKSRPRVTERDVPTKVIRILERGLAIDPAARPELPALLGELAATRQAPKTPWIAGGLAVAVASVTAVVMLGRTASPEDPCSAGLVALAQRFDPIALHASLGGDGEVASRVMPKVNAIAAAWRETHTATCAADRQPVQQPAIAACLDARRLELGGFVDDTRADGPGMAVGLVRTIGDPAACARPAPSLTQPNVPDDPALRRKVTPLRYRMIEARALGEKGELAKVDFVGLATDARVWPRVHAEALYLLGMAQAQGGDPKAATKTYREAAAVAQTAHHDLVAADCWIELTAIATFDDGDATRGLEYITYAEAALERLGHPVELEAQLAYIKGTTLIEANRVVEAETSLRRAIELGKAQPETLAQALQGLGYLHERQGRYRDAVAAYRQAIDRLAATGQAGSANDAVFRARLALDLALIGEGSEAEREARRAVELADQLFGADSPDRASAHETLAHVLHAIGKHDDALAVARATRAEIAKSAGERSKHYADLLSLEGEILDGIGRFTEAVTAFERACDILAFETGADSVPVTQCRIAESHALAGLGKRADALGIVDRAVPLLRAAYGDVHPLVAGALVTRGEIHGDLGHRSLAIADLEAAIAILEKAAFDPGVLGSAQFALALQLATGDERERARARALAAQAVTWLSSAPATWKSTHADAVAWLARQKS